jgi:hypothetical protein
VKKLAKGKRTAAQQAQAKENYSRLKAAGFSSKDAASLRYASPGKLNAALSTGIRPQISERHQRAGRGESYTRPAPSVGPYGVHKGRIKADDYKDVSEGFSKIYHAKYAYLMTYETQQGEVRDRKFYTILSETKLNKRQLKEEVKQNCQQAAAAGVYEARLITKSIELVEAYYNPDYD